MSNDPKNEPRDEDVRFTATHSILNGRIVFLRKVNILEVFYYVVRLCTHLRFSQHIVNNVQSNSSVIVARTNCWHLLKEEN